ncbi:MAG: hypothetical protein ABI629_00670 [bacterium]
MTKGVLFLCTGNACRSQMAEGIARPLVSPGMRIFSAGTSPKGVDARAVQVMHELGIDLSGNRSKTNDDASVGELDRLITLRAAGAHRVITLPAAAALGIGALLLGRWLT